MDNEINIVSTSANMLADKFSSMEQGVISTLKSYCLRITFHNNIAAKETNSFDGSGQSKLKTWKGFVILDAIKKICDSGEEVKISTLTGVWKALILLLMDDCEEFKTSVEEVNADVVEIARELEVKPEDVTKLPLSDDKNLTDEELLLMDQQRKLFLEIEPTPSEDAVKIVEPTTKDLEYYIYSAIKAATEFERIDFNFESSPVGEIPSKTIGYYREIICETKNQSMPQPSLLSYFKKLPQSPQPSATTTLISQSAAIYLEARTSTSKKDYDSLKAQMKFSTCSNKLFLIKVKCIVYFRHNAIGGFILYSIAV